MVDASEKVTQQDFRLAELIAQEGRACVIVVNKWDTVKKDGLAQKKLEVRRGQCLLVGWEWWFQGAVSGKQVPSEIFGGDAFEVADWQTGFVISSEGTLFVQSSSLLRLEFQG